MPVPCEQLKRLRAVISLLGIDLVIAQPGISLALYYTDKGVCLDAVGAPAAAPSISSPSGKLLSLSMVAGEEENDGPTLS